MRANFGSRRRFNPRAETTSTWIWGGKKSTVGTFVQSYFFFLFFLFLFLLVFQCKELADRQAHLKKTFFHSVDAREIPTLFHTAVENKTLIEASNKRLLAVYCYNRG